MSKQVTIVVDDETVQLMEQLKKDLKAPTTAALFRRALALTLLAVDQAKGDDGTLKDPLASIAVRSNEDPPGQNETVILLRG